jgi:oligopeptide transport system ATP-binding protein
MIFQDAMTSLNPTMTIGRQIAETLIVHRKMSKAEALAEAVSLLKQVHIPEAEKRARQYPFEFSGGMLQRAMIAMTLACEPDILIADEPTTALDVTIQAQILQLLKDLQKSRKLAIILITHDLGVVAQMAHDVAVMYAGQIVEQGTVDDIFYNASHPYTVGLKAAMPSNRHREQALEVIEGSPPDLFSPPVGCSFCDRCDYAMKVCEKQLPELVEHTGNNGQLTRCWLHHELAPENVIRDKVGQS